MLKTSTLFLSVLTNPLHPGHRVSDHNKANKSDSYVWLRVSKVSLGRNLNTQELKYYQGVCYNLITASL